MQTESLTQESKDQKSSVPPSSSQTAPSFSSFKFQIIGQPPSLSERFSSPVSWRHQSMSPLPQPPASNGAPFRSQNMSTGRPSLLETLGASGSMSSQSTPHHRNSNHQPDRDGNIRMLDDQDATFGSLLSSSGRVDHGMPSTSRKGFEMSSLPGHQENPPIQSQTSLSTTNTSSDKTANPPLVSPPSLDTLRELSNRLQVSLTNIQTPDNSAPRLLTQLVSIPLARISRTAHHAVSMAKQAVDYAQESLSAAEECVQLAEATKTRCEETISSLTRGGRNGDRSTQDWDDKISTLEGDLQTLTAWISSQDALAQIVSGVGGPSHTTISTSHAVDTDAIMAAPQESMGLPPSSSNQSIVTTRKSRSALSSSFSYKGQPPTSPAAEHQDSNPRRGWTHESLGELPDLGYPLKEENDDGGLLLSQTTGASPGTSELESSHGTQSETPPKLNPRSQPSTKNDSDYSPEPPTANSDDGKSLRDLREEKLRSFLAQQEQHGTRRQMQEQLHEEKQKLAMLEAANAAERLAEERLAEERLAEERALEEKRKLEVREAEQVAALLAEERLAEQRALEEKRKLEAKEEAERAAALLAEKRKLEAQEAEKAVALAEETRLQKAREEQEKRRREVALEKIRASQNTAAQIHAKRAIAKPVEQPPQTKKPNSKSQSKKSFHPLAVEEPHFPSRLQDDSAAHLQGSENGILDSFSSREFFSQEDSYIQSPAGQQSQLPPIAFLESQATPSSSRVSSPASDNTPFVSPHWRQGNTGNIPFVPCLTGVQQAAAQSANLRHIRENALRAELARELETFSQHIQASRATTTTTKIEEERGSRYPPHLSPASFSESRDLPSYNDLPRPRASSTERPYRPSPRITNAATNFSSKPSTPPRYASWELDDEMSAHQIRISRRYDHYSPTPPPTLSSGQQSSRNRTPPRKDPPYKRTRELESDQDDEAPPSQRSRQVGQFSDRYDTKRAVSPSHFDSSRLTTRIGPSYARKADTYRPVYEDDRTWVISEPNNDFSNGGTYANSSTPLSFPPVSPIETKNMNPQGLSSRLSDGPALPTGPARGVSLGYRGKKPRGGRGRPANYESIPLHERISQPNAPYIKNDDYHS